MHFVSSSWSDETHVKNKQNNKTKYKDNRRRGFWPFILKDWQILVWLDLHQTETTKIWKIDRLDKNSLLLDNNVLQIKYFVIHFLLFSLFCIFCSWRGGNSSIRRSLSSFARLFWWKHLFNKCDLVANAKVQFNTIISRTKGGNVCECVTEDWSGLLRSEDRCRACLPRTAAI